MLEVYGKSTRPQSVLGCITSTYRLAFLTEITEHKLEIVQDLEDLYIQEDQNAVFMCEVSLEEVAGEWYKDGHKIRPSSTIKIRTEGQRISQVEFTKYHNTI